MTLKKSSIIFIDTSAWLAIVDKQDKNYSNATEYFKKIIKKNARLVTSTLVVDEVLYLLKNNINPDFAKHFLGIIDESVLTVNLRLDWTSRRSRRIVINNFLKSTNPNLSIRYFYMLEAIKKKKADVIFTFDPNLKELGYPLMPI